MPRCPICGCLLEPSDLGSFSIDNVWYHERCIPEECDSCSGQMVADNCYRIWREGDPLSWKARHRACPAN